MGIRSRSLNRNKLSKRTKIIWSLIIAIIILICSYIGIFHSHRYFGFDIVLTIVMVGLFSILGLDFVWFDHGKWHKLKSLLSVVIVGGPIVGLVIYLHSVYVDNQLIGHGIAAKGVVTEVYIKSGRRNRTPYAVFQYAVNGKTFTQNMINNKNPLMVGDTLELTCSQLDPEVFVRKSLEE